MDPSFLIVVDDGSGSDYSELFQHVARVPDTVVLKNAVNLGKGAALKHGMNHVLVNHPDCLGVVTADADGQHAADDILKGRERTSITADRRDIWIPRFQRDVPFRSKIGNFISRYIYRFLIGLSLSDTQTGLRGIPRRLMELSLGIRSNRYEFETEQIIAAKGAGLQFKEVPIRTVYIDDNRGSHFNPVLNFIPDLLRVAALRSVEPYDRSDGSAGVLYFDGQWDVGAQRQYVRARVCPVGTIHAAEEICFQK